MIKRLEDPYLPGARLNRDDFGLTRVINCRPPDNDFSGAPYADEAIRNCSPYLLESIAKFKPRAILAMGNQPLKWLTGHWGFESLRGYRLEYLERDGGRRIPVVPTYPPTYIQFGNWELVRVWQLDLLKALAIAKGTQYDRPKQYWTHPSPQAFRLWAQRYFDQLVRRSGSPLQIGSEQSPSAVQDPFLLSFDIETPYIKGGGDKDEKWKRVLQDDASWMIFRISFSFEPFNAISVPWTREYLDTIRALLASQGDKLVWNRHFDVPRVAANGCPALGRTIDGMELWHYLEPSLPMGLKYVATFHCPDMQPWKLMSKTEPEWYNAADADTALRTTLALIERCKREGRWANFNRHVVDLGSVLDALTIRGINVDSAQRNVERERFEALLAAEELKLQDMVPDSVRPKKVYKSDEERLRRDGQWIEGRMVEIVEDLTEKEQAAWLKKQASAAKKVAKAAAVLERKVERERKRLEKLSMKKDITGVTRKRKS